MHLSELIYTETDPFKWHHHGWEWNLCYFISFKCRTL